MSLYLLFNLQRCWFPKHHSSNIYYPHCFLCFGCQAMGCWWKKMHKSCDNYRFILWSFIVIMPVITSALLSTSQMSQSYSLTYYSLLFDTSNHPPFFCPHSCENITAYVTNWILLKKKKQNSNSLIFSLLYSQVSVQVLWILVHSCVSSLGVVITIYSPLYLWCPTNFL